MPEPTVHKLGSPRKLSGEFNTWDVIWALQINGVVHQVTMRRRLSQKIIVKHDSKELLDKAFVLSKPYEGYCFVAWVSQGATFGIYYNTSKACIRTSADHYDLHVNGVNFIDLPDGCKMRQAQREIALKRSASVSALPSIGVGATATRNGFRSSTSCSSMTDATNHPAPGLASTLLRRTK